MDCGEIGGLQAQRVGQPWGGLVLLVAFVSTMALLGGGGCCVYCGGVYSPPFGDDGPDPRAQVRQMSLLGVLLLDSILSNLAHSAIQRRRARLACSFATLLDRILEAARSSRDGLTPPPLPSS